MPERPQSDWVKQTIEDGLLQEDQYKPPVVLQAELVGRTRRKKIKVLGEAGDIFRASIEKVTRVLVVFDERLGQHTYRSIGKAPSNVSQFPHEPLNKYKGEHLTEEDTSPSLETVRGYGSSHTLLFDVDERVRQRGGDPNAVMEKPGDSFLFRKHPSKFKKKR